MLEIVQVSVGTPKLIGYRRDKEVLSSINKHGLPGRCALITLGGIDGDEQTDKRIIRGKRIHGGPLKAIYAYPDAHLAAWAGEGVSCQPGIFGENLTVTGAVESDIHVGDEFVWGSSVILRVTSPRRPCYKLPIHLKISDIAEQMNGNGQCGWYFEVVSPGNAPTDGRLELIQSDPTAPTIAEIFAAKVKADPSIPDMPDN